MSDYQFSTAARPLSTSVDASPVWTPRGWGFVKTVAVSPYYAEERRGIQRAYVTSTQPDAWADWFTLDEVEA